MSEEFVEGLSSMTSMPIEVRFKQGLRTDGEIEVVTIKQLSNELRLTKEQAITLARALSVRLGAV